MPYVSPPGYVRPGYFEDDDGLPWVDGIPEPRTEPSADEIFQAWLQSETATRCLLVEATYRDLATGVIGTEYLASAPFVSAPGDSPPNQSYAGIVKSIPQFQQSMADVLIGRTTANMGAINVFSVDASTDSWLLDRDWVGRPLALYIGDPSWPKSRFRLVWSGTTADMSMSGTNTLVIQARDAQYLLNQPLAVTTLATGPQAGQPWPLCFGDCSNVTPVLLDDTLHRYAVHDGQVRRISAVRVAGVALTPGTGYATDEATGTFALVAAPTGQVTCDVQGAIVDGVYLQTAAQLLRHLAVDRGAFPAANIDADAFATFATDCPQFLGLFQGPQVVNVYQLMDAIILSVGGYYAVSRDGLLRAARFDFDGDPVLTIEPQDIVEFGLTLERTTPPVRQISLGSARNWTPQTVTASGVSELARAAAANPYTAATVANPDASLYGKVVDDGLVGTLLTSPVAAATEATRRVGLWGQRRYQFAVKCFTAPQRLNLGDAVTVKHPRYGLSSGRTGVVVKMVDQPSRRRVDLGVLM